MVETADPSLAALPDLQTREGEGGDKIHDSFIDPP
jgi:hypothetical protein